MTFARLMLLAPLLVTAPLSAQQPQGALNRGEKSLLAYCIPGDGCKAHLSEVKVDDLQLALPGTEAMKGAKEPILVFPRDKAGEWTYYVDTRRQLGELHRLFGGVGQPEIALFPPALPGEIQPRDGHWSVHSGTPVTRGCLAGVAEAVARQRPMMGNGDKRFQRPFHGRQLIDNAAVAWVKTAPNRYRAGFAPSGNTMRFRYEVRIASPDLIDGNAVVAVAIPGMKPCTITTPFTYHRR